MFSEIFSFGKDYPISHLVTFISGENVIIFHILVELGVLFVVYETIPKKKNKNKIKTKTKQNVFKLRTTFLDIFFDAR